MVDYEGCVPPNLGGDIQIWGTRFGPPNLQAAVRVARDSARIVDGAGVGERLAQHLCSNFRWQKMDIKMHSLGLGQRADRVPRRACIQGS